MKALRSRLQIPTSRLTAIAAKKTIAEKSLMPGRWIKVRKMKEQEADGDLIAIAAKLFAREDGTTPLIGFNGSHSVNNETLEATSVCRRQLGFENWIRFEPQITETWKSIVKQPYNRRGKLLQIADHVANISAKHEGADPEVDCIRDHPTDILDYFRDKKEVVESGDWDAMQGNFLDKWDAVNHTARALTEKGLSFAAAKRLHK